MPFSFLFVFNNASLRNTKVTQKHLEGKCAVITQALRFHREFLQAKFSSFMVVIKNEIYP